ncbi:uncharacterized protein LOC144446631 isoform X3 [Glandiceps talaboti]
MASCKKAPKWNSFGCSWYCVFAIVTFLYLMVDAVGRYNHYNGLTWPEGEKPTTALIFYIVLMVAATLTMLAFIPTQLFKTGNPSNDGEKLGRKKHEKKFDMGYDSRKGPSRAQRLLHHFGPLGATLHLVSAFCLLLPILLLQAAEVQHGHLPAEAVWSTELDFIFGSSHRSVLSSVQPVPLTSSPLSTISSTESLPVIKTYYFYWITLWILFTVKKDWKFTTQYIYDKPVIPSSQYSTMTVSRKHGGSQQSLSRVVGDGIEMTVVNSGARHTVKNVMKQEAIMRAMKQHPNPPTHNGTLERMHRNPLNKSQDSLQREHGVSDKHPMQSPLPSRHQYNHNSNNHNGTSTLTKSSHSPTDTKGSPFKRNDPTRKILTEKRSLSATSSSDGSGC